MNTSARSCSRVLLVVGLLGATMVGMVARAQPASASRQAYATVTSSVIVVDYTRVTPPRGSTDALPYRSLPTSVIRPDAPGAFPLVVFAAGFNISTEAYVAMTGTWAAAGYVVASPTFPISSIGDGPARRDDMANEPGDISAVISYLEAASRDPYSALFGRIDVGRIGVAGHSDGGIDAAAIAFNSAALDGRVKATIILSAEMPTIPGGINGPFNRAAVLVMSGSSDSSAPLWASNNIYDTAAAPKAQVTLIGGGHIGPFVSDPAYTETVWAAQIDFLDSELRSDPSGRSRLIAHGNVPGVSTMRLEGLYPEPFGSLDRVTVDGLGVVTAAGWAIDPDTDAPIEVHLYANGGFVGSITANAPRPDVANVFADYGPGHGFDAQLGGWAPGSYNVCAYGINVGSGLANSWLGCQTVAVTRDPFGNLDELRADALGRVTARGWALDPDTTAPIAVHAYVDGVAMGSYIASQPRGDIAAAFPAYGAAHGFSIALDGLGQGSHSVCIYGINVGAGTANRLLGACLPVFVSHLPFGNVDTVAPQSDGRLSVTGWAIDPDTAASIDVHLYVDGVPNAVVTASDQRADVGAAYDGYGNFHGFSQLTLVQPSGVHTVCAYGINGTGTPGNNALLACKVMVT